MAIPITYTADRPRAEATTLEATRQHATEAHGRAAGKAELTVRFLAGAHRIPKGPHPS